MKNRKQEKVGVKLMAAEEVGIRISYTAQNKFGKKGALDLD